MSREPKMLTISTLFSNCVKQISALRRDTRGASAVEFAFIIPLMLALLFGLVEITNGVAADRKVTLATRTLSDLVSQATTYSDTDFTQTFTASTGVMHPFDATSMKSVITEVKVDNNGNATVAWSKANANATARATGSPVTIAANLAIPNSYLIMSEVSYNYAPGVNWFIAAAGITLKEQMFTRPRQSNCVVYNGVTC